ncbi:hypothetical protein BV22DRAFT_998682 [Leucogyrophana mollusca]|uniref:Uncharacterized protein n=1 Tax=Leucogyrophana mollusca TaxID=85980 RepID=A0ACB8BZR3_9AGAM|nr:hypothetical protein BV22DRAFT_998682 [Leucogyrophana mollusca]
MTLVRIQGVILDHPEGQRTARDINEAIANSYLLEKIGTCPTRSRDGREYTASRFELRDDDEDSEDSIEGSSISSNSTESREKIPDLNEEKVFQLAEIVKQHAHVIASGSISTPFKLHITRNGCEYDDAIQPTQEKASQSLQELLKNWYEHAAVSGFGDMRLHDTVMDENVRQARELTASEFSVEPALLHLVENLWNVHFFPDHSIRAEPYKIHIYGPGGHFAPHRDTPKKDLVGTFLLGLGDTTLSWDGKLVVDGKKHRASPGNWCAFYPDVPHSVQRLQGADAYRATIAFKIFRTSAPLNQMTQTYSQVHAAVCDIISTMETPFGLLLERKYCMGTTELSGMDALLIASARARPDVRVHLLPVITRYTAEWCDVTAEDPFTNKFDAEVFPFTDADVDYLLGRGDRVSRTWIQRVGELRFYSTDFDKCAITLESEEIETVNYVGNEAEAWREDSIYLSYAMLILPADLNIDE